MLISSLQNLLVGVLLGIFSSCSGILPCVRLCCSLNTFKLLMFLQLFISNS
jgi:hypothetical protein